MHRNFLGNMGLLWMVVIMVTTVFSQFTWEISYGDIHSDKLEDVVKDPDYGFITVGQTSSSGAGSNDVLLMKVDNTGMILFSYTIGGGSIDWGYGLKRLHPVGTPQITTGFVVTGRTMSFGAGQNDAFIFVWNYLDNSLDWFKTYGSPFQDLSYSIAKLPDGYAICGYTTGFGIQGARGIFVLKVDLDGNLVWAKVIDGPGVEEANSIVYGMDGYLYIGGFTSSFGAGLEDGLIIKLDHSDGSIVWAKTLGSPQNDRVISVAWHYGDNTILLGGFTLSPGFGNYDAVIVKLDPSDGTMLYGKRYGTTYLDQILSIVGTGDGGAAVAGRTRGFSGGTYDDAFIMKTGTDLNIEWVKIYGGPLNEVATSLTIGQDGRFFVCGENFSFSLGLNDAFLVKTNIYGEVYGDCHIDVLFNEAVITPGITSPSLSPTYVIPTVTTVHTAQVNYFNPASYEWCSPTRVEEIENPIQPLVSYKVEKYGNLRLLIINGVKENDIIQIFNSTGALITKIRGTNTNELTIEVKPGILFLSINNTTTKLLIP